MKAIIGIEEIILIDENGNEINEGEWIEVESEIAENNGAHEDNAHDEEVVDDGRD